MASRTGTVRKKYKRLIEELGSIPCGICGLPITKSGVINGVKLGKVSVDHIIPKSLGGTSRVYNLQPTHATCNWNKGARPPKV